MDTSDLKSGDAHYRAYVGPPAQYDFMGATQFHLLCTLGLREHHKLLDFGCGSLRAGRLLIPYLAVGNYYGIDPNKWLIEDAIKEQLGNDQVRLKEPNFDFNENFRIDFPTKFDFILAQSIFSHCGAELINICLNNFREALAENGIVAATFIEDTKDFEGIGWAYPKCVKYREEKVYQLAEEAKLFVKRIPWYHPRQAWYLFSTSKERLPTDPMMKYLRGAVLFDSEFSESYSD